MSTAGIQEWIDDIENTANMYGDYFYQQNPDDTCGWKARISELLYGDELPAGLLITGPEGCGRHTILTDAVKMLYDMDFSVDYLTGYDLEDETATFTLARQRLSALLEMYRKKQEKFCIVLDEMEDYPFRDALLKFLEKTVCEYQNTDNSYPSLLFILFQNAPFHLPAVLKKMLYPCCVQYPNRTQRSRFLNGQLKSLCDHLSMDVLLDKTEGSSYAELVNLVKNIKIVAKCWNGEVSQAKVEELVEEQRLPVPTEMAKERLFRKLEQALDSLPDLLGKIGSGNLNGTQQAVPVTQQQKTEVPKDPAAYLASQEQRLMEMPGNELVRLRYSEERLKELCSLNFNES